MLVLMGLAGGQIQAQERGPVAQADAIHWAFAPLVGTGWYQVEGGGTAFVLKLAPSQEFRAPGAGGHHKREYGVRLNYHAAVGLYDLGDLSEIVDRGNISTLSFTPGIEIEVPMSDDWRLKTLAHVGYGSSLGESLSAWIYYAGLKSRLEFGGAHGQWALLNAIYYAGYEPNRGPTRDLTSLYTGLEFRHSPDDLSLLGRASNLYWQLGFSYIGDGVQFGTLSDQLRTLGETIDFGVAIGPREGAFRLGFWEFDRVGVTFATDSNGDFKALTFRFKSWFDD